MLSADHFKVLGFSALASAVNAVIIIILILFSALGFLYHQYIGGVIFGAITAFSLDALFASRRGFLWTLVSALSYYLAIVAYRMQPRDFNIFDILDLSLIRDAAPAIYTVLPGVVGALILSVGYAWLYQRQTFVFFLNSVILGGGLAWLLGLIEVSSIIGQLIVFNLVWPTVVLFFLVSHYKKPPESNDVVDGIVVEFIEESSPKKKRSWI
jgi:hypothetical protein